MRGWSPDDYAIAPGDLNGDGLTDLFLYNTVGQWWQCYSTPDGTGFTYSAMGWWSPGWGVTVGDFSGDGLADLVLYDAGTGAWYECWNDGAGGFITTPGGQYWDAGWSLWAVNWDQDGQTDLFFYRPSDGHWATGRKRGRLGEFGFGAGIWSSGLTVIANGTRVP